MAREPSSVDQSSSTATFLTPICAISSVKTPGSDSIVHQLSLITPLRSSEKEREGEGREEEEEEGEEGGVR